MPEADRSRWEAMAQSAGEPALPAAYRQVAWIGYAGNDSFLWTGVLGDNMTSIRARISKLSVPQSGTIFPAAKGSSDTTPRTTIWGTLENVWGSSFVCTPPIPRASLAEETDIVSVKTEADIPNEIGLGYHNSSWTPVLRFHDRLTICQEDAVLFDGLPCYREADGKIGLYDVVSQRFFPSYGEWEKGDDL